MRWYDVVASAVYASHFVAGLTIAGVLWLRDRARWLAWIRRYVTISYLALVGYVVYPMAPPWMAADDGLLPPLARISSRGFHHLGIDRTNMVFGSLPNRTAAMPSLHCGISFLIAFYAIRRLQGVVALAAAPLPGGHGSDALVYTAEHYLIDAIMGGVIALLAMAIGAAWDRRRPPEVVVGQQQLTVMSSS